MEDATLERLEELERELRRARARTSYFTVGLSAMLFVPFVMLPFV